MASVRAAGEASKLCTAPRSVPPTTDRGGRDPVPFRYQVEGPGARGLVEAVFDGPPRHHTTRTQRRNTGATNSQRPFCVVAQEMSGGIKFPHVNPYHEVTRTYEISGMGIT